MIETVEETADLLDDLIRSGAPSHIIKRVALLLAASEALTDRRAKDAARKASKRSENKGSPQTSADVRGHGGQTRTSALAETPLTTSFPESISEKQQQEPPKERPPTGVQRNAPTEPFDELAAVLDAEHAAAVVEHRRAMGKAKALTGYAARQLAKRFAKCPDPNAAADAMIANGWQGFDPTWLEAKRPSTGPPPNAKPTLGDILRATQAELAAIEDDERPPNLDLKALPRRAHSERGDLDQDADFFPRSSH